MTPEQRKQYRSRISIGSNIELMRKEMCELLDDLDARDAELDGFRERLGPIGYKMVKEAVELRKHVKSLEEKIQLLTMSRDHCKYLEMDEAAKSAKLELENKLKDAVVKAAKGAQGFFVCHCNGISQLFGCEHCRPKGKCEICELNDAIYKLDAHTRGQEGK